MNGLWQFMKKYRGSCAIALLLAGIVSGCSYERSTEVSEPPAEGAAEGTAEQTRDYRGMIDRVRNRNAYNHSLNTVKMAVEQFQLEIGRLPTNLVELLRFRYLDKFPEQVPPGFTYGYDYQYGRVTFMKMDAGEGAATGGSE